MNSKKWLGNFFLIFISAGILAQDRADSLVILNAEKLPPLSSKPIGLQEFKLDIQPMRLIEPEIYLFGPSDLLPGFYYDFKPGDKSGFSLLGGYPVGLAGERLFFNSNTELFWFAFDEDVRWTKHEIGNSVSGFVRFEAGNQQYVKKKDNEYLYEIDLKVKFNKLSDTDTLTIIKEKMVRLSDYENEAVSVLPVLKFMFKTNPLFFIDNWNAHAEYQNLQMIDKSISGSQVVRIWGDYTKNMTLADGYIAADIFLSDATKTGSGSIINLTSGLSYTSEFGTQKIAAGVFSENYGKRNSKFSLEFISKYHSRNFHQSFRYSTFDATSVLPQIIQSPVWFASGNEPNKNGFGFAPQFPLLKTQNNVQSLTEFIPSVNWILNAALSYREYSGFFYNSVHTSELNNVKQLQIKSDLKFYINPVSNFMVGFNQYHYFDKEKNVIISPFESLTSISAGFDYLTENRLNQFRMDIIYHMNQYYYVNGIPDKFDDTAEIYFHFEDFHWNAVNLFSDLRLYLRSSNSATGRYIHYNYAFIGVNFNF